MTHTEQQTIGIIINGDPQWTTQSSLSYDDISILAYGKVLQGLTVVYHGPKKDDCQRSGILWTGKSVVVEDGMKFTAMFTGNA